MFGCLLIFLRQGLDAQPESKKLGNRRVDIEIRIGPLATEAEHGQCRAKEADAIRNAETRLAQRLAQCAIVVCSPDGTTKDSLPSAQLFWTVSDSAAPIPAKAHWSAGYLRQLVSVSRLSPVQLGWVGCGVGAERLDESGRAKQMRQEPKHLILD